MDVNLRWMLEASLVAIIGTENADDISVMSATADGVSVYIRCGGCAATITHEKVSAFDVRYTLPRVDGATDLEMSNIAQSIKHTHRMAKVAEDYVSGVYRALRFRVGA